MELLNATSIRQYSELLGEKEQGNTRQENILLFKAQGKVPGNTIRHITLYSTAFPIWTIFSSQEHFFSMAFPIFQLRSIFSFSGLGKYLFSVENGCKITTIFTDEQPGIVIKSSPQFKINNTRQGLVLFMSNSSVTLKTLF